MKLPIFDFMGKRRIAAIASITAVVVSVAFLGLRGLNLGLDFTGGTLVEVGFPEAVDPVTVRNRLEEAGFVGIGLQHLFGPTSLVFGTKPEAGPAA